MGTYAVPPADSSIPPLRACIQALYDFLAASSENNLASCKELVDHLRELRRPTLLAGVAIGETRETMTALVDQCLKLCIRHCQKIEGGCEPESTHIRLVATFVESLRTLEDMAGIANLPANTSKPKQPQTASSRRGRRDKNHELLEFERSHRKKNHLCDDKEILAAFKKKQPNHPIFEANDPCGALRAARSRARKKHPST